MINGRIADIFEEIADILEVKEENPFRIRAYRRAAQAIRNLGEDIEELARKGRLVDIAGVGKDLGAKIEEFLQAGTITAYEKLKQSVDNVLLDMLRIPGVGPKTARLLHEKFRLTSLADLEAKARAHKIRNLPGIKEKTEENILKGLNFLKKDRGRMRLDVAFRTAKYFVTRLHKLSSTLRISPAGSLRRMKDTVRDIDILVTARSSTRIMDVFTSLPLVADILAKGDTRASIVTKDNIHVDLRVVAPESYGAALMYFTGSKAHNIKLRELAVSKGRKINEYGVFRLKDNRKLAGKDEREIYSLFGMSYIEPEIREDTGEIELALRRSLPRLVRLGDISADFHIHTLASDGHLSLERIAGIARKKNYDYVVITEHSKSLKIAHGLSNEKLLRHIRYVRNFNKKQRKITFLIGSEVDIHDDGSLDYDNSLLRKLDFVIAAVHSGFRQSRDKLTRRIISAMRNRYVNLIAHPSGRLIGQREAYDLDYERIFATAKETDTAIEINACPERLDLTDVNCRRARELGVRLAIATDTHTEEDLDNMIYGVGVARRGWVGKECLLNCCTHNEVKRFVEKKRLRKDLA